MEIQECREAVQQAGDGDEGDQPICAPPDDDIDTGRLAMPQAAMPTLLPFAKPYSMRLPTVAPRPMAGNVPMAIMSPFIANQGSKRSEKFEGKTQRDEHQEGVWCVCS
jgi:hypothetical protein